MEFVYYWTHSDLPATAGQVRFRLTSANDPFLFESGSDLRKPDGTPWAILLARLLRAHGRSANSFVQTLLDDGLASKDFINSNYFPLYEKLRLHAKSLLIETPDDMYPVSFPRSTLNISAILSDGAAQVRLVLDDQPWVEDLKLAEPEKRVNDHARLQLSDNSTPRLQVVRIFAPSGAQLDSSLPSIQIVKWWGQTGVFRS
ncbi:hypothetical protein IW261DRAFT_1608293 [Armillaria novae-zelandiae]|uniref:Uncharacterized protein n=1 Tax=Armillaria novae-zelandiae TaxID=153914 RepID=A0AA39UA49_9AGAR|nr:hypothetical protein IW261DRAFT_1608293 [Armillaria novae-zelandiae]